MDEKISMMMGQPMTRISSSAETTEEKNSNNSNNQMDHESSSAVPAVVLVSIHEDEQNTLQEQRLKMLKRKSERLCCGIFGSVIISLIIFSVVLSKYQNQIVDIITNRKEAGVDLWVILWFLAFVSTQPVFPGATFVYVLTGFLLGWYGFFAVYTATCISGWFVFLFSKYLVEKSYLSWEIVYLRLGSYQDYIRSVERAIADKSWKAPLILQLSATPYGLLNMFLALSQVKFSHFVFATIISRIKLISHIALGVSVNQLLAFNISQYEQNSGYIYITVGSAILTTCAVMYIGYYAKKYYESNYLRRPMRVSSVIVIESEEIPELPNVPESNIPEDAKNSTER